MAPVFIQDKLRDPMLTGIVISLSSFFGMFFDIYAAKKLAYKDYRFFLPWAFIFALIFPTILGFLPPTLFFMALAMVVWSVYYEFNGYAKYNFVHKSVQLHEHTYAWSSISTFQSIAYMIGPAVAIFLMNKYADLPFHTAIVIVLVAAFAFSLLSKKLRKSHVTEEPQQIERSFPTEFRIIKTLTKKLWVLLIFNFALVLLDVSFWTTGVLYTEEIRKSTGAGDLLLTVYGLPALFVGLITPMIHKRMGEWGKKRISFVMSIVAGAFIVLMGLSRNVYVILGFVFLSSTFYGVACILMSAVFEDYVARLEKASNDIVSILQFAGNFSYAIGPIILGVISKYFGFGMTFVVVGANLLIVSLLAAFMTPRKIKMPQTEIALELER